MQGHFMASFHTTPRDRRRDRVTHTVTRYFGTCAEAMAWGASETPHFNVYQFHRGIGWWSINWPLPAERI